MKRLARRLRRRVGRRHPGVVRLRYRKDQRHLVLALRQRRMDLSAVAQHVVARRAVGLPAAVQPGQCARGEQAGYPHAAAAGRHVAGERVQIPPAARAPPQRVRRRVVRRRHAVLHAGGAQRRVGHHRALRVDEYRQLVFRPGRVELRHVHQVEVAEPARIALRRGEHPQDLVQREREVVVVVELVAPDASVAAVTHAPHPRAVAQRGAAQRRGAVRLAHDLDQPRRRPEPGREPELRQPQSVVAEAQPVGRRVRRYGAGAIEPLLAHDLHREQARPADVGDQRRPPQSGVRALQPGDLRPGAGRPQDRRRDARRRPSRRGSCHRCSPPSAHSCTISREPCARTVAGTWRR